MDRILKCASSLCDPWLRTQRRRGPHLPSL